MTMTITPETEIAPVADEVTVPAPPPAVGAVKLRFPPDYYVG